MRARALLRVCVLACVVHVGMHSCMRVFECMVQPRGGTWRRRACQLEGVVGAEVQHHQQLPIPIRIHICGRHRAPFWRQEVTQHLQSTKPSAKLNEATDYMSTDQCVWATKSDLPAEGSLAAPAVDQAIRSLNGAPPVSQALNCYDALSTSSGSLAATAVK